MNLFNKRPLALILFIMLGGFSVFALGNTLFKIISLCISLILCFCVFVFRRFSSGVNKLACISLLISFILSHIYFNYIFYPYRYFDEETEIIAKVENIETKSEKYRLVDLKTISIDGTEASRSIKLNLYGDYENLDVGAVIEFKGTLTEFSSDADFDFKQFYTSRGFSATIDATDIDIVGYEDPPLSYYFTLLRGQITERSIELSDDAAGSMLSALLLGERELLSGQVRLDFQRIGITHILSLSGMHVAILMGGLDRLLYLLRIKKTPRILLGCLAALLFMGLTGFPLTVCRAAIMLIVSSVLFLITGSKDSITSLFVSAALIIAVSPYAAVDIGLWLSVIATLGILVGSELINSRYSEQTGAKKLFHALKLSLLFSLFAISASAMISALSFSSTSAISVLSTLIFSLLTEIFVYFGILVLIVGDLIPLGSILIFISDSIYAAAGWLADLPFIYGSVEFAVVKIGFILLCAAFFLFAVLDIKKKNTFIAAIATLFCISTVLSIGCTERARADDSFICFSDSSDKILIKSNGSVLLYDASSHRSSDGYMNNSILSEERITKLDYYMIANYTGYTYNSIRILLTNVKVEKVLLPLPRNADEDDIALEIFEAIGEFRTDVIFYDDLEIFELGEYQILTPFRDGEKMSFATTFKRGNKIYTYLSSGVLEYIPYSEELLYVSHTVIFGNHGTAYTTLRTVDEFADKIKLAVIYDEKVSFDTRYAEGAIPDVYYPTDKFIIYDE